MTAIRKLLAAALTLSLPLAALAQTPPAAEPSKPPPDAAPAAKPTPPPPPAVQVYGTFNVNLQYSETTDATGAGVNVAPRFGISADSSNVGVRGTLKLTEGYSAVYQCETGANIEGEGLASLCNRNSRIGLTGFWGTLAYGNWDTPMKSQHYGTKADDPFGNTDVFGFQGLMGSPGYQVKTGAINGAAPTSPATAGSAFAPVRTAGFDLRGANSVLYWTPKIAGMVSGRLQWGANEFRSSDGQVDPMFLSAGVNVDVGMVSVVGAAEYHEDSYGLRVINAQNTSRAASKDLAWRLGAGADLPLGVGTLNVMGMFEQLSYKQDDAGPGTATAAAYKDYSRMAWLLGAKFRTGNHELRARYTQALDPDITAATGATAAINEDDLAAQQYAVGYAYHLAKSTQAYVFYTQIMNDDRANYTFGVAGSAIVTTSITDVTAGTVAGADPMAVGIGMRHAF